MSELRFNPLLGTYTMIATNRQARPNMPKGYCPFCVGSGKVPDNYRVLVYPNDFPSLSTQPDLNISPTNFYESEPNYGHCEVILYHSDHNIKFYEISDNQLFELMEIWKNRFIELSKDEKIKFVFIFENKGEEVGVTQPHPHGQIYGYSFIPLKIETELKNCLNYYEKNNSNLFEDMIKQEKSDNQRIIFETESFIAFIPYFSDYPYGVFIVSKDNISNIGQMNSTILIDLASILKKITKGFDKIFDQAFPYMMCIHQSPVNSDWDSDLIYRFHIEFYTPLRAKNTIKWYASSEMGAWAAANTLSVEECAQNLKKLIEI